MHRWFSRSAPGESAVTQAEGRLDRFMLWFVQRFPPRVIAAVALVSYPGLALIVPTILGWSGFGLIAVNLFGALWAAAIVIWWLLVQLAARDRRHLLDWTTDLRLLDGQEFEWLVGEVFRREGWKVVERGRQDAADGNIDLELSRGGERRLVQCKRWSVAWIGIDEIRKFGGTLAREKLPTSAGIFVTSSHFNSHAVAEARALGIELLDSADLHRRAEAVRRPEACPDCHQPMTLDHSVHGWWFRCTTPGCSGKRNLDRDPGRAVAILTEPRP
jgi:hypothetical protein